MTASLFDQIITSNQLHRAWRRVRANHGMPGSDGVTLQQFAQELDANLAMLADEVQTGRYRPARLRQVQMRSESKIRLLGVPSVRDRVLQRATLDVLAPRCDLRFAPSSYGYRPGRGVRDAVRHIVRLRDHGLLWVVDADIKDCFGRLDHGLLRRFVRQFVPDRRLWYLLDAWIASTPVGMRHLPKRGVSLGSVISPFFCNLYLHQLDLALHRQHLPSVRYADDFVILANGPAHAARALRTTERALRQLKLTLNGQKTQVTSFDEGFTFLGVRFERNSYAYLPEGAWTIKDHARANPLAGAWVNGTACR